MRKTVRIFILIFILTMNSRISAVEIVDEYELKAAFLERFTRFIEWPSEPWSLDKDQVFEITVFGDNPFGKKLDKLYAKQKIQDKTVKIRYIHSVSEIGQCQMLFICPSASEQLTQILYAVSGKSILTVGETRGFCERGVHINFYTANSKLKFQINEKAARNSNLRISLLLLQNATVINRIGGKDEK